MPITQAADGISSLSGTRQPMYEENFIDSYTNPGGFLKRYIIRVKMPATRILTKHRLYKIAELISKLQFKYDFDLTQENLGNISKYASATVESRNYLVWNNDYKLNFTKKEINKSQKYVAITLLALDDLAKKTLELSKTDTSIPRPKLSDVYKSFHDKLKLRIIQMNQNYLKLTKMNHSIDIVRGWKQYSKYLRAN